MSFLEELKWRGMLQDHTPGIEELFGTGPVTGYIGFDPTAPSLTIGNYVQIMLLTLFQQAGNRPVVLMGGATGRIGDPSMRDTERELKSYEELDNNLARQIQQFNKLLNFTEGENKALLRNNLDFYKNMNALDFLRDVGKSLTVNYMMAKESVKKRIETGISFTEFSYQLIQGYDFQLLYEQDSCRLQMGGSDQWGNITSGTEMIRRNISGKAYALTTPLLTKADGTKFGKSLDGNIWLDPNLTSPYKFYQFWINADDRDLPKYLRYFSLKPKEEIVSLIQQAETDPRPVKKALAEELTRRIHSEGDFRRVMTVSEILFNQQMDQDYLSSLVTEDWASLQREVPGFDVSREDSAQPLSALLTGPAPVFASKSELRRAIQSNALSVNKEKVTDPELQLTGDQWLQGSYMLVENGKKNKFVIRRIS